jgi:hypothetical protein
MEQIPNGSSAMPDAYDRQLAALHDLPDVTRTKPTTIRTVPPLGVGGTQVWVVQTYRQQERGDVVFLEVMGQSGAIRLAIPAPVAATIARQRDSLTSQIRSKVATRVAADRKARGIVPGFMLKRQDVAELRKAGKRAKKGGAR